MLWTTARVAAGRNMGANVQAIDGLLAHDAMREPLIGHSVRGVVRESNQFVVDEEFAGGQIAGPRTAGNAAAREGREGDSAEGGDGFHGLRVAPVVHGDGEIEELHEGV